MNEILVGSATNLKSLKELWRNFGRNSGRNSAGSRENFSQTLEGTPGDIPRGTSVEITRITVGHPEKTSRIISGRKTETLREKFLEEIRYKPRLKFLYKSDKGKNREPLGQKKTKETSV